MATLFKRKGSRFWQAAYSDGTGKRVYRSTGAKSKSEAREIATEWTADVTKAKRAVRDNQSELMSVLQRGAQLQAKGRLTHDAAVDLLQELHELGNPEDQLLRTVRAWCSEWIEGKASQVKMDTLDGYRVDINATLEALGKAADRSLEQLTARDVETAQKSLKGGGCTSRTVNKKMSALSQAIKRAQELGFVPRNVVQAVPPLPEEDSVRVERFTTDEIKKIIQKAPDNEWTGTILLLAHTGLRRNSVVKLIWRDVDLERGVLTLVAAKQARMKRKKVIEVPLSAECADYLRGLPTPMKKAAYVFPVLSQRSGSAISDRFETIRKAAGVAKEVELPGGELAKRSLHSLRHWMVSELSNNQIPQEVRMALAAHKDTESHKFYTHVDPGLARAAIDTLPRVG
jgi:integrase